MTDARDPNANSYPPRPRSKPSLVEWAVVACIILILCGLFIPAVNTPGTATHRSQCSNNLRNIVLALIQYDAKYGTLPPTRTVDAEGNPLHSWRAFILPYLDQQILFEQIDFSKPWDHPANDVARQTELPIFQCPSISSEGTHTTYLAIVGEDACLHPTRLRSLSEITDDRTDTAVVVEFPATQAVHWMQPTDADASMFVSLKNASELPHGDGVNIAFADGTIRLIGRDISDQSRRAMVTISAGDDPGKID